MSTDLELEYTDGDKVSDDGGSKPVIQSYVHHGDKCFFVSTIERRSSAAAAPDLRYNETIVWNWHLATRERGIWIHQGEDAAGSIKNHLRTCNALHAFGTP